MKDLIRAELLKLRTTRTFWWSVAASLAFVPVSVALAITGAGNAAADSLDSTAGFRNAIAAASSGGIVIMLVGIVLMAGEYRFNTVTSTFLITPDRRRVVAAKIAASSLVGFAVAAVASLLTLAIALPWLSSRHVELASHVGDVGLVLLGAIAATTIAGMVGVGIGALLTNQTLAITTTLIWSFVVEAIAVSFVPELGRWMPGGAAGAMSGASTYNDLLPGWAAALVFAGYGVAFAAAGTRFVLRRDVA
jgi:ABC-type transport system involved in multi-copper enzyme maturation permease subunit